MILKLFFTHSFEVRQRELVQFHSEFGNSLFREVCHRFAVTEAYSTDFTYHCGCLPIQASDAGAAIQ
jgi:hypothetical protein